MATKYLLVSLPVSIAPSGERDDAFAHLRATVPSSAGTLYAFPIPELKIGTLDALVRQADELAKLDSACAGVVGKIGDGLRTILEGDPVKMSQQKMVNESKLIFLLIYFTF
jgi:V-type H+-transporting ATPase subunit C